MIILKSQPLYRDHLLEGLVLLLAEADACS